MEPGNVASEAVGADWRVAVWAFVEAIRQAADWQGCGLGSWRSLWCSVHFNDLLEVCDMHLGEVDAEVTLGEHDVHALAVHRGKEGLELVLRGVGESEHRAVVRAEGEIVLVVALLEFSQEFDFLKVVVPAFKCEGERGLADLAYHRAVWIRVLVAEVLLALVFNVSQSN